MLTQALVVYDDFSTLWWWTSENLNTTLLQRNPAWSCHATNFERVLHSFLWICVKFLRSPTTGMTQIFCNLRCYSVAIFQESGNAETWQTYRVFSMEHKGRATLGIWKLSWFTSPASTPNVFNAAELQQSKRTKESNTGNPIAWAGGDACSALYSHLFHCEIDSSRSSVTSEAKTLAALQRC